MSENDENEMNGNLDPLQEKRKRRLIALMNLLRNEREIEKRRLCGQLSVKYGIRRPTIEEYLRDLEDFGVIEISGEIIRWISAEYEEDPSL
jgi:hypothetical protein